MPIHQGGCLCGATRYRTETDPQFSFTCYCRDCQHVSGGGHAPQVAFPRESVTVEGPLKVFHGLSDKGNALEFGFCGDCGAPLTKTTEMAPKLVFVYAGSLDDPALFTAPKQVFESSRQPWDR